MFRNMLKYISLILFVGYFVPSAFALYSAQEVFQIRQNMFDNANDLHIKFWQKEDSIEVLNWNVGQITGGLGAPNIVARGSRPAPYNQGDNGMHDVDLDWNNITPGIPQFTMVSIQFTWWLTSQNTKNAKYYWTKDGQSMPPGQNPKRVGNNGWKVDNPVPIGGGLWRHTVHICNYEDPNDANATDIIIRNLKYSSVYNYNPLDANDLLNWSSWSYAPVSTIVLHPGECIDFDVNTPFGTGGHTLGSYEIVDSLGGMTSSEPQVLQFEVFDHPTGQPDSGIPTVSQWGLIIMGLVLLTAGAAVIMRRQRATA